MLEGPALTDPAEALNGQRRTILTWDFDWFSDYSLTHSVFSLQYVNSPQVIGLLPLRAFLLLHGSRQDVPKRADPSYSQLHLSLRQEDFTQVL